MDAKHAAAVIAASVLASLRIALEHGALTADNLADIARAAGANAAQQLLFDDTADADR